MKRNARPRPQATRSTSELSFGERTGEASGHGASTSIVHTPPIVWAPQRSLGRSAGLTFRRTEAYPPARSLRVRLVRCPTARPRETASESFHGIRRSDRGADVRARRSEGRIGAALRRDGREDARYRCRPGSPTRAAPRRSRSPSRRADRRWPSRLCATSREKSRRRMPPRERRRESRRARRTKRGDRASAQERETRRARPPRSKNVGPKPTAIHREAGPVPWGAGTCAASKGESPKRVRQSAREDRARPEAASRAGRARRRAHGRQKRVRRGKRGKRRDLSPSGTAITLARTPPIGRSGVIVARIGRARERGRRSKRRTFDQTTRTSFGAFRAHAAIGRREHQEPCRLRRPERA